MTERALSRSERRAGRSIGRPTLEAFEGLVNQEYADTLVTEVGFE